MKAFIIIGVSLLVLASSWAMGAPCVWRHKRQWVIVTLTPTICWTIGSKMENGLSMAVPTGWNKMDKRDIWYRPL